MGNESDTRIPLGPLCRKIGSGATPRGGSKVYMDSGDVAFVRSQNVYNDAFSRNGLVYITDTHAEQLSNVALEQDDVLLNITGDSVARCCQVDPDVLPARVNQHVAIIRPDPKKLDAGFLRYFLVSPEMQEEMLSWSHAGATRKALTKGMIESFKIPNLDLSLQRAIADILGTLDDKIELNRRMNATLEQMVRALFKSWFIDFDPVHAKANAGAGQPPAGFDPALLDHFPDTFEDSELGPIPEGWVAGTFGDAIDILDSKRVPLSRKQREERQGEYRYYGATGIIDYVDDFLFDGRYTLLGEDGSVIQDDGTPFTQYVWGKIWVNNHAHVLLGKNGWTTELVYLLAKDMNITPYVTGAVQAKLNQGNMKRIPIISPPAELLRACDARVQPLFELKRMLSDEIGILTETRDTLLPKLLSGELRVPEAMMQVEAVA